MKLYAIREVGTDRYLPNGGTRVELSSTKAPRMFNKRGHAKTALGCWLEGRWQLCGYDPEYGDNFPAPSETVAAKRQRAERQARSFEIVEFDLTETEA